MAYKGEVKSVNVKGYYQEGAPNWSRDLFRKHPLRSLVPQSECYQNVTDIP